MNGLSVRVLKDDGCNTNVVSKEFLAKYRSRNIFEVCQVNVTVEYSQKGTKEEASEVRLNGTLRLGAHTYTSNWIVANFRYDVLLGMLWHVAHNPSINYEQKIVKVGPDVIPVFQKNEGKIQVTNLGVKKFRRMLKNNMEKVELYQVKIREVKHSKGEKFAEKNAKLERLLAEFEYVFKTELPPGLPPKRSVDHEIQVEEDSKPPHRPLFRLSPVELEEAKEYVEKLLKSGKIRPSKSPYGASLFFVKQEKGKLRGVVDYRALNRMTKKNNAPIPRSDEIFDRLEGARVFSKLDLKTGLDQIRVKPEYIEKTAFNTKYGQFEYLSMLMELCNAPATFQTLINQLFYDCIDDFLVVYMDDLLKFSEDEASHLKHLETALRRLEEKKMFVSPEKCEFMKTEIDFLEFLAGKDGLRFNPSKVEVLKTWPKLKSLFEFRSFLGLLQLFRRFIPKFSEVAAPMTNLTKKDQGIEKWNEKCDKAFEKLKEAIKNAPILVSPDWSKHFRCHIDASQTAVGGTLTQLDENGRDRVIAIYFKKLSLTESVYIASDRELLGLISFLNWFRCYLVCLVCYIVTNCRMLNYIHRRLLLEVKKKLSLYFTVAIIRTNN